MIKAIKTGTPLGFNPKGSPTSYWSNCFTGTFSNEIGRYPIGIMINGGTVIRANSCHWIWGYPESVLWIKKDGTKGVSRVITYTQIPGYEDVVFALGGVGISDFNPKAEGFCKFEAKNMYNDKLETKDFSDVLRRTNHSFYGFKGGLFFGGIIYGHSAEVRAEVKLQGFTHVVMGDGGSWASCNTEDFDLNTDHKQYSLVQIVDAKDLELVKEEVVKKGQWKHFRFSEFDNTMDGNANLTKDELIDKLDKLRELVGRSIKITSGYRTPAFNRKVHGDPKSEHIHGLAADLRFDFTGYTPESIARIVKYLGFTNCGIYWDYGRIGGRINRLHLGIRNDNNGRLRIMDWSASGKYLKSRYI